jgi:hypothetical protein
VIKRLPCEHVFMPPNTPDTGKELAFIPAELPGLVQLHELSPGHVQARFKFPNNYGASVVQGPHTYGGDAGLWELAVLRYEGDRWDLCYTTPITDDVLGYLDEHEVLETLIRIRNLP